MVCQFMSCPDMSGPQEASLSRSRLPWGFLNPVHGPGPHGSPPEPSALTPATPQTGRSPAPHGPALPSHGPRWARSSHGPTSQPSLGLSPLPGWCAMVRLGLPGDPQLPCLIQQLVSLIPALIHHVFAVISAKLSLQQEPHGQYACS